jgi:hypothetical protein
MTVCREEGVLQERLLCPRKPQKGATHTTTLACPDGRATAGWGVCAPVECQRRGKGAPRAGPVRQAPTHSSATTRPVARFKPGAWARRPP